MVTTGFGNNPNQQQGVGYSKVALGDGRHWDLDAGRRIVDDRHELRAGPMRWTCTEPLQRWTLELDPNLSGIAYKLHYESRAPMWELLPIEIRKRGQTIVDMFHIKQPGRYTVWVEIEGERISVDGFHGGRDCTFGVRMAEHVDFWLWFEAGFEDRAIEDWVWESRDGTVQYCDGGIVHVDGTLSKRFVRFEHNVTFDGDRKRPLKATVRSTDENGRTHDVVETSDHPHCTAHYRSGLDRRQREGALSYYVWNGDDGDDLVEVESNAVSLDQLMRFEMDGLSGHGIFGLAVWRDKTSVTGRGVPECP